MELYRTYFDRHRTQRDIINIGLFLLAVFIGTMLVNTFFMQSFRVEGRSMESTLFTGDRLVVNRIPVTLSKIQNKDYVPDRGQVIVFKNPLYQQGASEEYIVKRVIAFPGERVVVSDGTLTVYNAAHPQGFHPDDQVKGPGSPTSGNSDITVTDGSLYVAGDHREGSYSLDSRNQLGLIPYYDVIGPVGARIYPFNQIRTF